MVCAILQRKNTAIFFMGLMTKNAFLDWLYFEHRARVTFTTNANKQKVYTAKNDRERVTFGKHKRGAPLVIKRIMYTDTGTVKAVEYYRKFTDLIKATQYKGRQQR